MTFPGRWLATVLGLVWPLAAAGQETGSAPPVTTVRIRSEHFVNGAVRSAADSLNRARSDVRVEVKPALWLTSLADLAAGKADLIVVYGSGEQSEVPGGRPQPRPGQKSVSHERASRHRSWGIARFSPLFLSPVGDFIGSRGANPKAPPPGGSTAQEILGKSSKPQFFCAVSGSASPPVR